MPRRRDASCPSFADLLLSDDGDLPLAQREAIYEHLRTCEHCCEQMDRWTGLIDCCAAAFPEESTEISDDSAAHFNRWLQAQENVPAQQNKPGFSRLAEIAGIVALVFATLSFSGFQPSTLRAEAVLKRAVSYERPGEETVRGERLRWTPANDRRLGNDRGADVSLARLVAARPAAHRAHNTDGAEPPEEARAIELLADHGFDRLKLLSAAAFHAWRASLLQKSDTVNPERGFVVVTTSTREGNLREVRLMMREDTLVVVRQTFELDGLGRLEVERASQPANPFGHAPTTSASAGAVATPTLVNPALLEDAELDARLVLQENASLRDDASIERTRSDVQVTASIVDEERRRLVSDRLAQVEHVLARVSLAHNRSAEPRGTLTPAIAALLDHKLSKKREAFTDALLSLAASIHRSSRRLDELSRRYPSVKEGALAAGARQKLQRLVHTDYQALTTDAWELNKLLVVLCGSSSSQIAARSHSLADWQGRVQAANPYAARLEGEISNFLYHDLVQTAPDMDLTPRLGQVSESFDKLWNALNTPVTAGGPTSPLSATDPRF